MSIGLLAAGIIMKQIAAMEVAHTSYALEQQQWAVQNHWSTVTVCSCSIL